MDGYLEARKDDHVRFSFGVRVNWWEFPVPDTRKVQSLLFVCRRMQYESIWAGKYANAVFERKRIR